MSERVNQNRRTRGSVAPGFESVQRLYEYNMRTMAEDNSQLCIYYKGKKVVDLWASMAGDNSFTADSLVNIFSSGKSLESIAMASLVGRGLLEYDAKITDYWPEFGASGKAAVTIADLMRHEAGLANFKTSIEMEDLLTAHLKQNKIGSIIEEHPQNFSKGSSSNREYHALTRGWIVNEIFRRVDPEGRTVGEFLRQDISGPLKIDAIIGVRKDELERMSKVKPLGFGYQFIESLKPKIFGRKILHNLFQILGRLLKILLAMRRGKSARPLQPFADINGFDFFNDPGFAMGETPSANATCSARGLATIAAMMSSGGKLDGIEYLSEYAWNSLHDKPVEADMSGYLPTSFTQGGVAWFADCNVNSTKLEREFNQGREGFYGWMGLGGSIFQWHPKLDIGFAFVPTSLHVLDLLNERGKTYQAEVLSCVDRLNQP
ncbi:MAG: CubicO group peptidase (beta-lactamase class C family) [Halieaceae bacterium]|jgi:CubicO group peptidase (beta-lactamase class C family)